MKAEPTPEFFYSTNYPHKWGNGPIMSTVNPDRGHERIASLEEAKELAEKFKVGGWEENRCDTTYGVFYRVRDSQE